MMAFFTVLLHCDASFSVSFVLEHVKSCLLLYFGVPYAFGY